MNWFWHTSESVDRGLGFTYFGREHLFCLAICVFSVLAATGFYCRCAEKKRKICRISVAVSIVVIELVKQIPLLVTRRWLPSYLPLHLCNINVFLILWHAIRPNIILSNFLYCICLPAAFAAWLFPGWNDLPAWNFLYIHSWVLHVLLVLYPFALTVKGDIRPRLKDGCRAALLLAGIALIIYFLNIAMQKAGASVNFFFLSSVTPYNPLYYFEKIWGNHLYGMPLVVTTVILMMYLPFEIKGKIPET